MPIDPLPNSPATLDTDSMRNKINELIGNNASVTVSNSPPTGPAEGDLWFDEGSAAMYVYVAAPTNAWIQTNPASTSGSGGGGGIGLLRYEDSSTMGKLIFDYGTSSPTIASWLANLQNANLGADYYTLDIDPNNTYIFFGMRDLTHHHSLNAGAKIPVYPSNSTAGISSVPVVANGSQPGYDIRAFIIGSKMYITSPGPNVPRVQLRFAIGSDL